MLAHVTLTVYFKGKSEHSRHATPEPREWAAEWCWVTWDGLVRDRALMYWFPSAENGGNLLWFSCLEASSPYKHQRHECFKKLTKSLPTLCGKYKVVFELKYLELACINCLRQVAWGCLAFLWQQYRKGAGKAATHSKVYLEGKHGAQPWALHDGICKGSSWKPWSPTASDR